MEDLMQTGSQFQNRSVIQVNSRGYVVSFIHRTPAGDAETEKSIEPLIPPYQGMLIHSPDIIEFLLYDHSAYEFLHQYCKISPANRLHH